MVLGEFEEIELQFLMKIMNTKISIIGGYFGLPLARLLAIKYNATGFDIIKKK